MAQNFTTDVTQWQGVDEEPTAGSESLVKSGGVKAALNPLELLKDRFDCVCRKFLNKTSINPTTKEPIYGANFFISEPIPVLNATLFKNLSVSALEFDFYKNGEINSTNFVDVNTTGVVPSGAEQLIIMWYGNSGNAPVSVTYEVECLEEEIPAMKQVISEIQSEIVDIDYVLEGYVNIPKSAILQKSAIGSDFTIITANSKFYLSPLIYVGGVKKVSTDNTKALGCDFYTSKELSLSTHVANLTDKFLVPEGAKYCIISFYDANNNGAGNAIPAVTKVFFDKEEEKRCIYIGDSISTSDTYFWKGYLENFYDLKYVRNASNGSTLDGETTDDVLWPANGGITLIPPVEESTYNKNKSIWYRCAGNRMSIYNFEVISLCGGTNDMNPNATTLGTKDDTPYLDTTAERPATLTFAAALMGCIEMLHRDFPTKPIMLCTVFACGTQGNEEDENGVTFSERMALLQMEIADKYALQGYNVTAVPFYWDMRNKLTARTNVFSKDTVHPNRAWAKRMMNVFAQSVPLKLT